MELSRQMLHLKNYGFPGTEGRIDSMGDTLYRGFAYIEVKNNIYNNNVFL